MTSCLQGNRTAILLSAIYIQHDPLLEPFIQSVKYFIVRSGDGVAKTRGTHAAPEQHHHVATQLTMRDPQALPYIFQRPHMLMNWSSASPISSAC